MPQAATVRAKLDEWKARWEGKDAHAIQHQIGNMLWMSAFYRSINESRRFLADDQEGRKLANGTLHELLDEGYFALHASAIRRLVDKAGFSGPRGVNSLYNLIHDIRDTCGLLTREHILASRNLPYDYELLQTKAFEDARSEAQQQGKTAYFVARNGWAEAEWWHENWDELCDVSEENRSPSDHPDPARLQRLLDDLEREGKAVAEYVNKFIAHAAATESIETIEPEFREISLAKLWRAERVIVRVSAFAGRCFLTGASGGGVPIPQFDQFVHLDKPFVTDAALAAMNAAWDRHAEEVDACTDWSWDQPLTSSSDEWSD